MAVRKSRASEGGKDNRSGGSCGHEIRHCTVSLRNFWLPKVVSLGLKFGSIFGDRLGIMLV